MKEAGWISIVIALVLFAVAIITAIANVMNPVLDPAEAAKIAFPWQLQCIIEAVIGFVFFIPGVALINRRQS